MEDLFWTRLTAAGNRADYHIVFEAEMYCFIPKDAALPTYRFRREHDEWQAVDASSVEVMDEAVEALEQYLMRQH